MMNLTYVDGRYHLLPSSYDSYVQFFNKVRLVRLNKEDWKLSTCNCWYFLKNYYCYHIIAIAANEKIIEIPVINKEVPIKQKSKRGRKSKALKALEKNID